MDAAIDHRIGQLVDDGLESFLKEVDCTSTEFKLLSFWGRHPKAKLSLYTIAKALDASAINLRAAIENLVEKGILTVQHGNDGLTTYALADRGTKKAHWRTQRTGLEANDGHGGTVNRNGSANMAIETSV